MFLKGPKDVIIKKNQEALGLIFLLPYKETAFLLWMLVRVLADRELTLLTFQGICSLLISAFEIK